MIIRKSFKFEAAHIVRNCSSKHCRENIHGHSYLTEVFITSNKLDNGFMIMDFGLLDHVKTFIESFDHTYTLWQAEDQEFKNFIYTHNNRVAEIPVSPSAEGFALLFFRVIDRILATTTFRNGEGDILLSSVRVHETATGYAEAFREDLKWANFSPADIKFSPGIYSEWQTQEWWENLK